MIEPTEDSMVVSDAQIGSLADKVALQSSESTDLISDQVDIPFKETVIAVPPADPSPI